MSDFVEWVLETSIAEGKLDDLKLLMQEMSDATQTDEPGALTYEWYTDSGGSVCHIIERYADSAAVMVHLGNFGAKFAERFMGILTPTKFTVYGPASADVRGALAGFGATHYDFLGGFHR